MDYAKQFSTVSTPQTEPIPGSTQVKNSDVGYGWAVDDWTRLNRFLVLGSEAGSYYASERKLTRENAEAVLRCLKAEPTRTILTIRDVSLAGRAPKNDPAIFALALCAALGETTQVRREALQALPHVCRIGTHLFHFMAAYEQLRGPGKRYGRSVRTALAKWYLNKDENKLAAEVVKYRQRDGWTHRDVLALCHAKGLNPKQQAIFKWVSWSNLAKAGDKIAYLPDLLQAYERAQVESATIVAEIIRAYDLPREAIPTTLLDQPEIWEALLEKMPMTAMIRNLATMTRLGVIAPLKPSVTKVTKELADLDRLKKARIHPIQALSAMRTYAQGHGMRNASKTWEPVPQIIDALDEAFYLAFGTLEQSQKRVLLGIDISGSMSSGEIAGVPGLTPRDASAAMALVFAYQYQNHAIMGFSHTFTPLAISPKQRLTDAIKVVSDQPFGATDCALPMLWATKAQMPVDAFVILTDSETNQNSMHPAQALQAYRVAMKINAKLIVVGMISNHISIADPNDGGMLDVCGFDTATPAILQEIIG